MAIIVMQPDTKNKLRLARITLIASSTLLLISALPAQAQRVEDVLSPNAPNSARTPNSTGGYSEPVIVNGAPALKFVSRTGSETLVYFKKYGDEDAFAIPVASRLLSHKGWLYVSRNRLAYEPDSDTSKHFNVPRTDVKEAKAVHTWNGEHYIQIKLAKGDKKEFVINFIPAPPSLKGLGGEHQRPVQELFESAWADFDEAAQTLQQQTATLPQSDSQSGAQAGRTTQPANEIQDSYDKFKGIRTISTGRIQVQGRSADPNGIAPDVFIGAIIQIDDHNNVRVYFYIECLASYQPEAFPTLIMLVDGRREIIGNITTPSNSNRFWEIVQSLPVSFDVIERIASAKNIEAQIGGVEFTLNEGAKSRLGEFVRKVKPLVKVP